MTLVTGFVVQGKMLIIILNNNNFKEKQLIVSHLLFPTLLVNTDSYTSLSSAAQYDLTVLPSSDIRYHISVSKIISD